MKVVNVLDVATAVDPEDPPGYRAARARVGALLGGERCGASVYALAPGEAVCPYHWEANAEEWLLVLEGAPWLRTPEGTRTLEPGELVTFPVGAAGAHQVGAGETAARVLLLSEQPRLGATVYPDSDKAGVFGPGLDLLFRRSDAVDYYDGEPEPGG